MNPVSQRLLSQQLAAPQFKDPAEVVSWFGAMQAQDYKSMRWAVSMRTRRPSGKAFEKAYNDGRIVRTHLLRTTWQLLAGEDLGWMLKLCRRKALAGLRGWMHANGVDIPLDEEKRISGIFGEALAGHRSVQKEFLAEAILLPPPPGGTLGPAVLGGPPPDQADAGPRRGKGTQPSGSEPRRGPRPPHPQVLPQP